MAFQTRQNTSIRHAEALLGFAPVRLLTLLALLASTPAAADSFVLSSGATLNGQLIEAAPRDRNRWVIELTDGGQITLDRSSIARHVRHTPAEEEYALRAPTVPDTIDGHFRLALWCRELKMPREFKTHLRRVIEIDPSHEEARRLLGYQKVGDRWLTAAELMAARGMIRFQGEFRTPQEVELLKQKQHGKQQAADWKGQLAKWRRWLTGNDPTKSAAAVEALESLEDPRSAAALARLIAKEQDYGVLSLLIDTAARIEHPATVQALVQLTLNDPDEETRLQGLEHLVKARRPGLSAPYFQALRSNDNTKVNRAGEALGLIGAAEAISPLIDALVTTHQRQVGNDSGGDTYQFTPSNGGFQFGGNGPETIDVPIKNPKVLSALVRISEGVSFGYDQPRWRDWLASQTDASAIDLRRDP